MKVKLECIPCLIRQAIETARISGLDEKKQRVLVNKTLRFLQTIDSDKSPPELGKNLYTMIGRVMGNSDPYKEIKSQMNRELLKFYPELKRMIYLSDDPVLLAAKLAAAGNAFDCGTPFNRHHVREVIEDARKLEFKINDYTFFLEDLAKAKTVLYLADNAGEIVLDKLFIEVIKRFYPERKKRLIVVVRGAPIINDATKEDAVMIALDQIVEVIDSADQTPGTVLKDVSAEMRDLYRQADLIIAKGQGNYETLHMERKKIYFLFMVKCPVISNMLKTKEGSLIIKRSDL
jgi:uncharacterized protein with ATP-grasp and redox domains